MTNLDALRIVRNENIAGWTIEFPDGGWLVVTDLFLTDIECSVEDYAERGEEFPKPSELETLAKMKAWKGWAWVAVPVDMSKLNGKSVRLNITLPERLVGTIDAYAAKHGESRSGFLARAAMEAMAG